MLCSYFRVLVQMDKQFLFNNNALFLIISLLSGSVTFFTLPFVINNGNKIRSIDRFEERRKQEKKLVRYGGISIMIGFYSIFFLINLVPNFHHFLSFQKNGFITLITSSFCFFLLGLFDDIFNLSPKLRLIIQTIIASFVWANGIGIRVIDLSFFQFSELLVLPIFVSYIFTCLWIVGVINSINWLDGMDSQVTIFSILSFIFFAIISFYSYKNELTIICILLLGCCLGFLPKNIEPAKVIMGDGGSYFLGSNLALLSILITSNNQFIEFNNPNSLRLEIALLILFIPIADMLYVIFLRFLNKEALIYPDSKHIHHRLIRSGFKKSEILLIISCICLILSSIALIILKIALGKKILVISILIGFCFFLSKLKFLIKS